MTGGYPMDEAAKRRIEASWREGELVDELVRGWEDGREFTDRCGSCRHYSGQLGTGHGTCSQWPSITVVSADDWCSSHKSRSG